MSYFDELNKSAGVKPIDTPRPTQADASGEVDVLTLKDPAAYFAAQEAKLAAKKESELQNVRDIQSGALMGGTDAATFGLNPNVTALRRAMDPSADGHFGTDALAPLAQVGADLASWYKKDKGEPWDDFVARYNKALPEEYARVDAAQKENPGAYLGGQIGVGLAQGAKGIGTTAGAGMGRNFVEAAKLGGKIGAASGAGHTRDKTNVGDLAVNTGVGGVLGYLAGGVGGASTNSPFLARTAAGTGLGAGAGYLSSDAPDKTSDVLEGAGYGAGAGVASYLLPKAIRGFANAGVNTAKDASLYLGGKAMGLERATSRNVEGKLGSELMDQTIDDSYKNGIIKFGRNTPDTGKALEGHITQTGRRISAAEDALNAVPGAERAVPILDLEGSVRGLASGVPETTSADALRNTLTGEADRLASIGENRANMSFKDLVANRRATGEAAYEKAANKQFGATEGTKKIWQQYKGAEDAAAQRLDPALADEFSAANAEYARYVPFSRSAENAQAQARGNTLFGLAGPMNGLFVTEAAGPVAGLGAFAADKLMKTHPGSVGIMARGASKLGAGAIRAGDAVGGTVNAGLSRAPNAVAPYVGSLAPQIRPDAPQSIQLPPEVKKERSKWWFIDGHASTE